MHYYIFYIIKAFSLECRQSKSSIYNGCVLSESVEGNSSFLLQELPEVTALLLLAECTEADLQGTISSSDPGATGCVVCANSLMLFNLNQPFLNVKKLTINSTVKKRAKPAITRFSH